MLKRYWRPGEYSFLIATYPDEGAAEVARQLGRSVDSVASQARRRELTSPTRRQRQAATRRLNEAVQIAFWRFRELPPEPIPERRWGTNRSVSREQYEADLTSPSSEPDTSPEVNGRVATA